MSSDITGDTTPDAFSVDVQTRQALYQATYDNDKSGLNYNNPSDVSAEALFGLVELTDEQGTTGSSTQENKLVYDEQGRLIGENRTVMENGEPVQYDARFEYDAAGNPVRVKLYTNGELTRSGTLLSLDPDGTFSWRPDDWDGSADTDDGAIVENLTGAIMGLNDDGRVHFIQHQNGRYVDGFKYDEETGALLSVVVVNGDQVERIQVSPMTGVEKVEVGRDGTLTVTSWNEVVVYHPDGTTERKERSTISAALLLSHVLVTI